MDSSVERSENESGIARRIRCINFIKTNASNLLLLALILVTYYGNQSNLDIQRQSLALQTTEFNQEQIKEFRPLNVIQATTGVIYVDPGTNQTFKILLKNRGTSDLVIKDIKFAVEWTEGRVSAINFEKNKIIPKGGALDFSFAVPIPNSLNYGDYYLQVYIDYDSSSEQLAYQLKYRLKPQ